MLERVRSWLAYPSEASSRLAPLAAAGANGGFALPSDLPALCARLRIPAAAVDDIVDGASRTRDHPEARWLLDRLHRVLADRGGPAVRPPWPSPWPDDDPLTRFFHLYAFLAAVPDVLRHDAERGIPEAVTWDTLSDVGPQISSFRERHGVYGFDGAMWMWPHFRGKLYRLGRLEYDHASGADLEVHIPADGPLDAAACDESLCAAGHFYVRHFPELRHRRVTCTSWLLDSQLADYLPPTANIVRFQRRFTPEEDGGWPGDHDVVRYVFGHVPEDLDDLPQETSLQRAIVGHLRDGGRWYFRRGWLPLAG